MSLTLALAGNPNSGKTTLFNALTGSAQFVGNWPGVTVEKKEGKYKGDKEVTITDLPGIYSLSPYTLEEVVSRNYIIDEKPDAIINIIDGTNLERNLYLTTQLVELGVPMVVAINMADLVEKNGDKIDLDGIKKELGCEAVEISALKETNLDALMSTAIRIAKEKKPTAAYHKFEGAVEHAIAHIEELCLHDMPQENQRWYAIKLFERDEKIQEKLGLSKEIIDHIEEDIKRCEDEMDDDAESIVTNERYVYIASIIGSCYITKNEDALTLSDKIDKIVTNRWLGLPIFALIMWFIYYVSVTTVGSWLTDWANDVFVGEILQGNAEAFLTGIGCADWLTGLIVDGIIGGVGRMLGFMPQMFVLFFFLAVLEDCGYMARIAFVMDRVFRHFGMSGKSFIPMLIGTGCGLPGIMAARTIESDQDRRMTIMTVTFMPCGAKLPLIACIAGALFNNNGTVAFACYVMGIASVIITGVIMKKTKAFAGETTPFVMELPQYHMPTVKNIWHSIYDRLAAFAKKAVTVYMLASILVWFISNFGVVDGAFGMVEDIHDSMACAIGKAISWIFTPNGFNRWECAIASILGLSAKEEVVGTLGVFSSIGDADMAMELVDEGASLSPIAALFGNNAIAGFSFLTFNLLCVPCFAAINTIRAEMQSTKYFLIAIGYQMLYSYTLSLMIFQFGSLFTGAAVSVWTVVAAAILCVYLYLLFRPMPKDLIKK